MTWTPYHSDVCRTWHAGDETIPGISADVTRWGRDREYEARGYIHRSESHLEHYQIGTYSDRKLALAACEAWIVAARAEPTRAPAPRRATYQWATDDYCDAYDRGEIEGPTE